MACRTSIQVLMADQSEEGFGEVAPKRGTGLRHASQEVPDPQAAGRRRTRLRWISQRERPVAKCCYMVDEALFNREVLLSGCV